MPRNLGTAGLLAGTLVALVLGLLPASPAGAEEPPVVAMSAPRAYADDQTEVSLTLTTADGPVADAPVDLQRRVDGAWVPLGTVATDASGTATRAVVVRRDPGDNRLRATFAGDAERDPATATLELRIAKREGRVTLDGPDQVVDETSVELRVRWTTVGGVPVARERVELQLRVDGRWRTQRRLRTDRRGRATTEVAPRTDTRWRARASALAWVKGDRSRPHLLHNLPPGEPVRLPAAAPSPRRKLPAQRHAVGDGPNPTISRIPDGIWRQMTGRTWHAGCPVGRARLRLLRINYWDYRGYRRRGELVAAAGVIGQMSGALAEMYRRGLPLRSMYRVDRFGWSSRLHGGDDYASMAAGNTSAFNCRDVVGRPGVRSPHSFGRSLDVNPWENPYRASHGWVPNSWWVSRSHPRVAWRSRAHQVVAIMARHGLRWTYGVRDAHHFDAVPRGGRLLRVPGCGDEVCH